MLDADPERLAQVLANLLDNATRHSPDGSTVHVTARRGAAGPRGGAVVVLEVHDSGPGVDPADRERVFDRFARTDTSRARSAGQTGGSGLGLAIVRDVAEIYEGTVSLEESEDLGGLLVRLRLPAAS